MVDVVNNVGQTQQPIKQKKNYTPFYVLAGTSFLPSIGNYFFNKKIEKDSVEISSKNMPPEWKVKTLEELEIYMKKGHKAFNIASFILIGASLLALIFAPKKQDKTINKS